MSQEDSTSRKAFFSESLNLVKRGLSVQLDKKLHKILEGPVRPPGALDELEFLSSCTRCSACVEACPYQALRKQPQSAGLAAGAPYLDLDRQACQLCSDFPCVNACETGALGSGVVQMGRAVVNEETCLTYQDQVCSLCYDACPYPERAINLGFDFHPQVTSECIGCGACTQICPTHPSSIPVLSPTQWRKKELEDRLF